MSDAVLQWPMSGGDSATAVRVWVHRELNGSILSLASTPPDSGDVEDGDIVTKQLVCVADLPVRKDAP